MKHSLIGRLNLLIKRFTFVSLFFVLVVAFTFGFATLNINMKNTERESGLWASYLKDFKFLLTRKPNRRARLTLCLKTVSFTSTAETGLTPFTGKISPKTCLSSRLPGKPLTEKQT